MKKLLIFPFVFFLLLSFAHADLGSCTVYHAKFYLKDGRFFNACFEVGGDGLASWLEERNTNGAN